MKNKKIVPIVGICVLLLLVAGNMFRNYVDRNSGPEMRLSGEAWVEPSPASGGQVVRYYTEAEIIATMEKNLEEYFPGQWSCSVYEKAGRTVVDVRFRSDTVATVRDLAMGGVANMPQEWDRLVESTRSASGDWGHAFEINQHHGYLVQFGYVDESAPDDLVFYCVNGVAALDPVRGVDLMADVEAAREAAAAP